MNLIYARESGEFLSEPAPAMARSGRRLVSISPQDLLPLPKDATMVRLPGRRPQLDGGRSHPGMAVAAVLPVGYLRLLLPATVPGENARRLPLFGYTAVVEHEGETKVAAMRTDDFAWWQPKRFSQANLGAEIEKARSALPGNRLVDHLAVCAAENRCYTAQNTFHRRYEGALPASPACNADCLGCISLQSDGAVPAPQERMTFAPTEDELVALAGYHLQGEEAHIVSFGQGCEGEALTRDDVLVRAVERIRASHPRATIHVNTNGGKPKMLQRLIDAGLNSCRISAISFSEAVFRAYYRPIGYGIEDVIASGQAMSRAGGQVCINLLTFPGITDVPAEIETTVAVAAAMGAHQIQWRSLNVDHDWLVAVMPELDDGIGMRRAHARIRDGLPGVEHGNFTRPWPAAGPGAKGDAQMAGAMLPGEHEERNSP